MHYAFALPAIPTNINAPVVSLNERNVWVRLEQDLTEWGTLGLRWDEYTPDTALSEDARDTFGVVGVVHMNRWLQVMLEYDHVIEHVHAPGTQAPNAQIEDGVGGASGEVLRNPTPLAPRPVPLRGSRSASGRAGGT